MSDDEAGVSRDQEPSQARHLHAFLRTAILFGGLAAGTAISVAALVRRHRISANAARDALVKLEDEGLVARETPDEAVVSDRTGR